MNNVKIGDMVRLPGFPGLLRIEDVSGARGTVSWTSSTGDMIRGEVFLSQLQPADWYQGKGECVEQVGQPADMPFLHEEDWHLPQDG